MNAKNQKILGIAVIAVAVALFAIWMGVKDGNTPTPAQPVQPDLSLVQRPSRRDRRAKKRNFAQNANGSFRKFAGESTDESQQLLEELTEELDSGEEDRILKAIIIAPRLETPEAVQFALHGLQTVEDPGFRQSLVLNLQNSPSKQVLPVLSQAMKDSDPGVRQAAIGALAAFDESREEAIDAAVEEWTNDTTEEEQKAQDAQHAKIDALAELLTAEDCDVVREMLTVALNDDDPVIRREAMSTVHRLAYELKLIGLDTAVASKYNDVVLDALHQISTAYTKDTLLTAMQALENRDEEVFSAAQEYVHRLVGQDFKSYDEAVKWWNDNAYKYDFDLVKITDGSISDEELYAD